MNRPEFDGLAFADTISFEARAKLYEFDRLVRFA
jgi:hypothetical protein